jgi:hypothetical protein
VRPTSLNSDGDDEVMDGQQPAAESTTGHGTPYQQFSIRLQSEACSTPICTSLDEKPSEQ